MLQNKVNSFAVSDFNSNFSILLSHSQRLRFGRRTENALIELQGVKPEAKVFTSQKNYGSAGQEKT